MDFALQFAIRFSTAKNCFLVIVELYHTISLGLEGIGIDNLVMPLFVLLKLKNIEIKQCNEHNVIIFLLLKNKNVVSVLTIKPIFLMPI